MNLHDKLHSVADMRQEERWISEYLRGENARRERKARFYDRLGELMAVLVFAAAVVAWRCL
jgi:hypothetical protein